MGSVYLYQPLFGRKRKWTRLSIEGFFSRSNMFNKIYTREFSEMANVLGLTEIYLDLNNLANICPIFINIGIS